MTIQDIARPGTVRANPAQSLQGLCGGAVYLPGDPEFDEARTPWNVAIDQRPAAVAYPANAQETAGLVSAAVAAGLRIAPQSTGHNAGPLGRLDDVVLVRTSAMTHVDIDPVGQVARVGGGALWLPVVEAAAAQGFAVLHGSSPDVGVAGYSLGGGIFLYSRKLGMQTNALTGVELVTADGSIRWASATENSELFWALRGGGGNFGIVTTLEFAMFPFRSAYAGMLVWDRTETERVLRRWVAWTADAPDEVSTSFRVLNLPPLPDLPESFRGRQLVSSTEPCWPPTNGASRSSRPYAISSPKSIPSAGYRYRRWPGCTWIPRDRRPQCPTPRCSTGCPSRRSKPSSITPDPGRAPRC